MHYGLSILTAKRVFYCALYLFVSGIENFIVWSIHYTVLEPETYLHKQFYGLHFTLITYEENIYIKSTMANLDC